MQAFVRCQSLSWLPWLLSDCGGFVTATDKVGRLFLIDPSNRNLAELEGADWTLHRECRAGGRGSQGEAAPMGALQEDAGQCWSGRQVPLCPGGHTERGVLCPLLPSLS